jgi:hypothetical protein
LNFEQFERRGFVKRFEKKSITSKEKRTHKKKKAHTKRKHLKQQWQHPPLKHRQYSTSWMAITS